MAATTIDFEVLRGEVNRLLDMFPKNGVTSVELDEDLYWSFGWSEAYVESGTDATAPKPNLGSLADDLDFVLKSRSGEPVALTLCHIAPLLNFLGVKAAEKGVY